MRVAQMEPGHRIQLPEDWVADLELENGAVLEKTAQGILIQPRPRLTWAEVFATKLKVGAGAPEFDVLEISDDDLLF